MPPEFAEESPVRVKVDGDELTLLVEESVYTKETLFRACYWFTDRCYLFISRAAPATFAVRVKAKPGGPALETVAGDFKNALLDQQVRQDLSRETSSLRELIVAKAFAEGNFLDDPPVGDARDPVDVAKSKTHGSDKGDRSRK